MLRAMIEFPLAMVRHLAWPWLLWVGLLIAANVVAALFFAATVEAQVVLGAIAIGAIVQMAIFARLGFVRLLGVGHAPWLITVPWLATRLDLAAVTAFDIWMLAVIVLNGVSLLIDIVDVIRYLRGERTPVCPA